MKKAEERLVKLFGLWNTPLKEGLLATFYRL